MCVPWAWLEIGFSLGVKKQEDWEAWNEFLLSESGVSPIRMEWRAVAPTSRGMGSLGRGGLRSESRRELRICSLPGATKHLPMPGGLTTTHPFEPGRGHGHLVSPSHSIECPYSASCASPQKLSHRTSCLRARDASTCKPRKLEYLHCSLRNPNPRSELALAEFATTSGI